MIRSLKLKCSICEENFTAGDTLHFRTSAIVNDLRDTEFICPACIEKWHEKWQIVKADFVDHDNGYYMTVDLTLADGTVYKDMDCTAYDEDETVVIGEDIPKEAQKALYNLYHEWDMERKKDSIKFCTFNDEGLMLTITLETYGGERIENMAFRFNRHGEIQTEKPISDTLKQQIIDAYNLFEMQAEAEEHMHK